MLNFDETRYVGIQGGAVGLAGSIREALAKELNNGAENIFFAGAGGVNFLTQPAARLLQTKSTFPTFIEMAAELVNTGHAHLGPQSVVVFPSVSGTTKEALAALESDLLLGVEGRHSEHAGSRGSPDRATLLTTALVV